MDAAEPPSSSASFPILTATVAGMLATAVLLVGYCVFVTRCRLALGHPSPAAPESSRGLEPDLIRAIPVVEFPPPPPLPPAPVRECAVCLSEFRAAEKVKLLPGCSHGFHIDCIDTWLQFNANCPLCRSGADVLLGLCELSSRRHRLPRENGDGQTSSSPEFPPRPPPKQGSAGDERVDAREKDEEFRAVQQMRRSFSMDSSTSSGRRLCVSIQEMAIVSAGEKRQQKLQCRSSDG